MEINRNDPCPCGSGKKYKKCCLETKSGQSDPIIEGPGNITLGIAWYDDPESFFEMKAYASDPEIWEDTYEEWLIAAKEREQEINKAGIVPVHVNITVNGLKSFCEKENAEPDAKTRAQYVAYLLETGASSKGD